MPDKRGTVVVMLGSEGAGKTTITEGLLRYMENAFNLNKDIMYEAILKALAPTNKQSTIQKLMSRRTPEVEQESLYAAILKQTAYNLRSGTPGKTAIVEGNFGNKKRLNIEMLREYFGNLDSYDFCLVHVICTDPELQFQRICARSSPKDKAITVNGKVYDLTNRKHFEEYRNLRYKEEESCIASMSPFMRVITVNNSNPSILDLPNLIRSIKNHIEVYNGAVVRRTEDVALDEFSIVSSPSAQRKSLSFRATSLNSPRSSISPPKHPMSGAVRPPSFELDKDSKQFTEGESTTLVIDLRKSSSEDKKKSSSPFLSFQGRLKKDTPLETRKPVDLDRDSGRKSPRFSDLYGNPMNLHPNYV